MANSLVMQIFFRCYCNYTTRKPNQISMHGTSNIHSLELNTFFRRQKFNLIVIHIHLDLINYQSYQKRSLVLNIPLLFFLFRKYSCFQEIMTELQLDLNQSIDLRISEFKNDAEKMKDINEFLNEIFDKAQREAEKRSGKNRSKLVRQTIIFSLRFSIINYFRRFQESKVSI